MYVLAQQSSEGLDTTGALIATGVTIGIGILAYGWMMTAGRRYQQRVTETDPGRAARVQTLWTVLRRALLVVVVVTVTMFIFTIWGWSMAPFIAVGTVIAAAVGFGAQSFVKDFLNGVFILMEDQFHVGDTITVANPPLTGVVEDIQLRVTVLRDDEGKQHFVPNGVITVTTNLTAKYARPFVDVEVPVGTDLDRAIALFREEMDKLAADETYGPRLNSEPEILGVEKVTDSTVTLRGQLLTRADQRWTIRREALRRVRSRFDAEGINGAD
jgi:small conductance mechanosensitive channel